MPRSMTDAAKRPRVSIDVPPLVRRRLRLAAARRDMSISQYLLETIEKRLREDLGAEGEDPFALTAKTDPVLAELWDNPQDARYEQL